MRTRIIGALVATAFVVAGCGSSSKTSTASTTTDPPATTEGAASTATASAASAAGQSTTASTAVASATVAPNVAPAQSAPASSAAPAAVTTAAAPAAPAGAACTGLGAAGAGTAADVKLVEWAITGPASVKAGAVTLNITNGGQNSHNLAVIKGSTWADLPKSGSGGVDTTKLTAGALLGTTSQLGGGKGCSTSLTLDAGSYVLLCTIGFGANSHAARGQHFDLTVAG